ncbi:hypothetical protein M885DRAFT_539229 [Pelagophyceae sp. CCMP2097]|nr:hypothetical protein M885DRAFT_539229 [Pelagophyceae sp. CCMP2097]
MRASAGASDAAHRRVRRPWPSRALRGTHTPSPHSAQHATAGAPREKYSTRGAFHCFIVGVTTWASAKCADPARGRFCCAKSASP